jgi:hypothetical protein
MEHLVEVVGRKLLEILGLVTENFPNKVVEDFREPFRNWVILETLA